MSVKKNLDSTLTVFSYTSDVRMGCIQAGHQDSSTLGVNPFEAA